MITVNLPWPDRRLSPNSRCHWRVKHDVTKKARADALVLAMAAGARRLKADRLKVTMVFAPPDNRRRDQDNMIGSTKAHRDGIADATGVDDHRWDLAIRRADPVKHGNVRVEIEVIDER